MQSNKRSSNKQEVGVLIKTGFSGFEGSPICVLFKNYAVNLKTLQKKKEVEVLDIETGILQRLPYKSSVANLIVLEGIYWKEDKYILLCMDSENPYVLIQEAFTITEKGASIELKKLYEREMEWEEPISNSSEVVVAQIYKDSLYLSFLIEDEKERILWDLESNDFEDIHCSKLDDKKFLCEIFFQNQIWLYSTSMANSQGGYTSSFEIFPIGEQKSLQVNLPECPKFSSGHIIIHEINDVFFLFCPREMYTYHPEKMKFEKREVFGTKLPSTRLASTKYKNKILMWKKQGRIDELYLLDIGDFDPVVLLSEKNAVPETQNPLAIHSNRLRSEENFVDIVFIVEKERFPAHKYILVDCKYFKNMFKSGMIEADKKEIEIKDVTPKCFKAILDYIYLREFSADAILALEMIVQADKFLLSELKEKCEAILIKNISLNNIGDLGEVVDKIEAPKLEEHVTQFIANHQKDLKEEDFNKIPTKIIFNSLSFQTKRMKCS